MNLRPLTLFGLATSLLTPIALFASDLHPIADFQAGYFLGSSGGGKWLHPDALAKSKSTPGPTKYRIYSASRYLGEVSGTKAATQGPPCENTFYVDFSPKPESAQYKSGVLAIAGTWNALPRVPRQQSTTQLAYRTLVANVLKSKGIKKPVVRIAQVMRVDLDGDGSDEVLINATNHRGSNGLSGSLNANEKVGEYSMILLRKIVKGKAQTTLVEGYFSLKNTTFSAPNVFKILGTFDVNGDGKMEIVTQGRYYEGDWTTVYSVGTSSTSKIITVKDVLGEGCGV